MFSIFSHIHHFYIFPFTLPLRWKLHIKLFSLSLIFFPTHKGFTDHLYNALEKKGILTFRDEEKLERGKFISQELVKAIEESRFAIVIFSINYAFSTWCLDELVHIVRCMKEKGLEVLPIFYHVDPFDVRKQMGTFAKAFDEHKEIFKESSEKVKTWRATLREVANLFGWDLLNRYNFLKKIISLIYKRLVLFHISCSI